MGYSAGEHLLRREVSVGTRQETCSHCSRKTGFVVSSLQKMTMAMAMVMALQRTSEVAEGGSSP